VCPDHVCMRLIHVLIVSVMDVLATFHRADSVIQHQLQQVHDVAHLHFDNEDQTPAMARLQVGVVKAEEVREVGKGKTEICSCIVIVPHFAQAAFRAPAHLERGEES
jgi:hypothetical protein